MSGWIPGRLPPGNHQPGNPLYPGPDMQHPPSNRSGMLPATPQIPRGAEAWGSGFVTQSFASDGTSQVWEWYSPLFDLRPGLSAAYGQIPAAVPINHEGALGQAVYMTLIIGDARGLTPPALMNAVRAQYWEEGNNLAPAEQTIMRLTQDIDCTAQLLSGGIRRLTPPFGASPISITPCVPSLRFWRVGFRMVVEGVAPVTDAFFLQACLH